jgi:hypothetical protein
VCLAIVTLGLTATAGATTLSGVSKPAVTHSSSSVIALAKSFLGAGATCASGTRNSAPKQGVTSSTITIGDSIFNVKAIEAAGAGFPSFTPDEQQAGNALIKDVNAAGGICGRKLKVDFTDPNPLDPNAPHAACLTQVDQNHVFAEFDNVVLGAVSACFTSAHVPFLGEITPTDASQASQYPYFITQQETDNEALEDLVLGASKAGFFSASHGFKKIGVLNTTCDINGWNDPQHGFYAELKKVGVKGSQVTEYTEPCDATVEDGPQTSALLKFKEEGVSTVVIEQTIQNRTFTAEAAQDGDHFQYIWGDTSGYANFDYNTELMNHQQINGSIGITSFDNYVQYNTSAQDCSKLVKAAGLPAVTTIDADLMVLWQCDHVRELVQAATLAGPDLTRSDFVAAVQKIGNFAGAVSFPVTFGPGKLSGGDLIILQKYYANCPNAVQARGRTGGCFIQEGKPYAGIIDGTTGA